MNPKNKKPGLVFLVLSLIFTGILLLIIASLVLGDLQGGAARGEPETGWGIAIAIIMFGPLLLVSSLVSFLAYKHYKKAENNL